MALPISLDIGTYYYYYCFFVLNCTIGATIPSLGEEGRKGGKCVSELLLCTREGEGLIVFN